MKIDLVEAAHQFRDLAAKAVETDRMQDAYSLMQMSFTSAMMARSGTPISFQLRPADQLPARVAHIDHIIVHLSHDGIVFYGGQGFVMRPTSDVRRMPMIGELFSHVARRLPSGPSYRCIIDLGDGYDVGDYRRIAYSSGRSDSVLIPDPYFYLNDNYSRLRDFMTTRAKPWPLRQPVLFWRGSATGPRLREPTPDDCTRWDWHARVQLCAVAQRSRFAKMIDVGLSEHHQIQEAYLLDALANAGFSKDKVIKNLFTDYQFLIDIDGWANSWSLLDKIITGAVIFKVESFFGYRQWYYDKLVPFLNYIPVSADFSDFDDALAWALSHPDDCVRIAEQAAGLGESLQLLPELAAAEEKILAALELI